MLPIIDMNPGDRSCIYSVLSFISNQAREMGIPTAIVTFDQPLWIKAVKIVSAKDMHMVVILGSFHMIMSFVGSISAMMADSGLSDALETEWGPVAVKHMLSL